jgi:hypothetical protein
MERRDDFEQDLRKLLDLKDRATARSIDAACCRTPRDFEKARAADNAVDNATDRFIEKWAPKEP